MAGEVFILGADKLWRRKGWDPVAPGVTPTQPTAGPTAPALDVFDVWMTTTAGTAPVPLPTSGKTRLGACPTNGASISGPAAKFGTGTSVRYFSGAFGSAVPRAAGALIQHTSFKPALGTTITATMVTAAVANLRDGDIVECWHESDVKYRAELKTLGATQALANLADRLRMKNELHAVVVSLRNAGTIPKLRTANTWAGYDTDSTSSTDVTNPNVHCNADLLGLDMDGILPSSNAYYPFFERQTTELAAILNSGKYAYTGWTIPEFTVALYAPTDPDATLRIAWFRDQVAKLTAGNPSLKLPPPYALMFFDYNNQDPHEGLSFANEIAAWASLVQASTT